MIQRSKLFINNYQNTSPQPSVEFVINVSCASKKKNNIMDGQELVPQRVNQNLYNVFSICQDFRQRLVQLQHLTETLVETSLPEVKE
jgi:hypothetical protein